MRPKHPAFAFNKVIDLLLMLVMLGRCFLACRRRLARAWCCTGGRLGRAHGGTHGDALYRALSSSVALSSCSPPV